MHAAIYKTRHQKKGSKIVTSIIEDGDEYDDAEICMARPQRKYAVNIYSIQNTGKRAI